MDDDIIKSIINEELSRALLEELSKLPWWCCICGVGGNYEGRRPDEYWFPPKDHKCYVVIEKSLAFTYLWLLEGVPDYIVAEIVGLDPELPFEYRDDCDRRLRIFSQKQKLRKKKK